MLRLDPTSRSRSQSHKCRTELFAPTYQRVLHKSGYLGIEVLYLILETIRYLIQKRLYWIAELSPVFGMAAFLVSANMNGNYNEK